LIKQQELHEPFKFVWLFRLENPYTIMDAGGAFRTKIVTISSLLKELLSVLETHPQLGNPMQLQVTKPLL
jgi:hypothetical protein